MTPENVLAPAKVWTPVVTTPRAVALASGMLRVSPDQNASDPEVPRLIVRFADNATPLIVLVSGT